jgi:hypothetical protein
MSSPSQPAAIEGHAEALDGSPSADLPVVAAVRALEPARGAASPAVQAVAVAATSFVAGAATIALVRRRAARRAQPARRRKSRARVVEAGEVVASRSFLIDVHLLNRE